MATKDKKNNIEKPGEQASVFEALGPYKKMIVFLVVLAIASNGLTLFVPRIVSQGIDGFIRGGVSSDSLIFEFFIISLAIFILVALQSVIQTYASERVAKDLRTELAKKISGQSYVYIQKADPSVLLTNLTSDIDSVKTFVSQAIVSLVSSVVIIIGASIMLLSINWRLALAVLTIIPVIGGTFFFVFAKVRTLFLKSREIIDWLNKVINESILGSALIRVLNSNGYEFNKFVAVNSSARDLGMQILRLFATMIPIITFVSNIATLIILALGGHYVIAHTMTLGEFAAFSSYIAILIFPILVIGFMSNLKIGRAHV